MKWPHERAYYRIEYPSRERPSLEMNDQVYEVIDACETGIRYQLHGTRPVKDDTIRGIVRFRRNDPVPVEGIVVRVTEGYAAVQLRPPGIPLKVIFDEQRFLLKHYPRQVRRPPD
jgi:hypothetical protein